ncbi:MAG: tetratricopeptide repeat protein [bacterium]|nr:tetratricopeptide repeat protein [bacterium]
MSPSGKKSGDPSLPVASSAAPAGVRTSKRGKWRAAVLIGIHVVILVHATHYLVAGKTLSPVEPSESMYTLELGQVNAGFVFFALALLSTLIVGRFFCGWGCHLVALQDLCGWMMKKLGVKPRAFRSRFLIYVPLMTALYMFVWPQLKRSMIVPWLEQNWPSSVAAFGRVAGFPGLNDALMTSEFWKTFPGPVFAVLTFATCGFVAVYLLGAKGFCTYACPYGGFFAPLDRLSLGRIRVTDACEQCGHCTATCTSNVRVHEEVKLYGMVVDPGCMKCTDCVSVCPNDALYFGFGRPSLFKGKPAGRPATRRYDFTLREELGLGAVFLVATGAFRRLYDGPPLLMALCLGGVTAFVALKCWRLLFDQVVWLQNLKLKSRGRITKSGRVFATLVVLWLAFTAHSGYAQWQRKAGRFHFNRIEATREQMLDGSAWRIGYSATHDRAVDRAARNFSRADRYGLFDVLEVKQGLAWTAWLQQRPEQAEEAFREALAMVPGEPRQHRNLADFLMAHERFAAAVEVRQGQYDRFGATAPERFELGTMLAALERLDEATVEYRACLELAPDSPTAHYNLGGVLRRLGRPAEAVSHLREAARLAPTDAATRIELGLALLDTGDAAGALAELRGAAELDPASPEVRYYVQELISRIERAGG